MNSPKQRGPVRKAILPWWALIPCCVAAAAVLVLGSLATTSDARPKPAIAGVFEYEAVHALLIVKDKASFEESGVKWNGFGRLVEKIGPAGLPIVLARRGATYPVNISGHLSAGGDETQTDSGIKDLCSGEWDEGSRPGTITLQVKKAGAGKLQSTWQIPTGFASPNCGRLYPVRRRDGSARRRRWRNRGPASHLTLTIDDQKTKTSKSGAVEQTVVKCLEADADAGFGHKFIYPSFAR